MTARTRRQPTARRARMPRSVSPAAPIVASPGVVAPTGEQAAAGLGRVARRMREGQALTLAEVAQRANISPAMLSRLETGHASPSLETIVSLASALGVKPALLLQELGDDDEEAQLVRASEGLEVVRRGTKRGHDYRLLAAPRGPHKLFEPFLVTLNDESEVFPGFQHPGTEFLHVLAGEIVYRHGRRSYHLRAGDSLTFRGDVAHGPEKLVKVPIRLLSVIIYGEPGRDPG